MSADYVGSSSGASAPGVSGGSSSLTQSILSSVPLAAENIILAAKNPDLLVASRNAPYMYPPTPRPSSRFSTWIVVAVVAFIGIFAYREL